MSEDTIFEKAEARAILLAADVTWEHADGRIFVNFNDTWSWASADCEEILEEDFPRVATLFWRYGWCGLLYWGSERNKGMRSEFQDINRFIDFVRQEEELRQRLPDSNKRAYERMTYTLGGSGAMSEKAEELAMKAAILVVDRIQSRAAGGLIPPDAAELAVLIRAVLADFSKAAEARESFLRADLERERAAAALVLETSAREVARLEREQRALREALWLGHGHVGILYGDDGEMQCGAAHGPGIRGPVDFKRDPVERVRDAFLGGVSEAIAKVGQERDALKAAAQRHLTTHGCDFVDANGRTCRDCDELRAALATPAEPPAACECDVDEPEGAHVKGCINAPATEPTEGGGE